MDETERLQRYKSTCGCSENRKDALRYDEEIASRILAFLNDPRLAKYSMVDAYYYDYSELPRNVEVKSCGDMYLLFGITEEGEVITKWVKRWDLDSDEPIINGEISKK